MELTPVSELSSTAEYEEECDLSAVSSSEKQVDKTLQQENKELHNLCSHFDRAYQMSRRDAMEWQSLGCYTAEVLKEEVSNYEAKNKALLKQVGRLTKENKELNEMCIFLDRAGGGSQERSLTPPEVTTAILYASMTGEASSDRHNRIPCYSGLTKGAKLKDSHAIQRGAHTETSKDMALDIMQKRLRRVEEEKGELVKSLSAAHLLAAGSRHIEMKGATPNVTVNKSLAEILPENLRQAWEKVKRVNERKIDSTERGSRPNFVSSDVVMKAVTLLDLVRRLEAATARGFSDGLEESETITLRLLVNIAWQKMQERLNNS